MATEVRQEHPDEDDANENAEDPTIPTSLENNNNNEKNTCGQEEIHAQEQTTIPSTSKPQVNNDTTPNVQSDLEVPMETNVITVKAELLDETIALGQEPQQQINNDEPQNSQQQTNSEILMETSAVTVKEEPDPSNFENLGGTNNVEVKEEPDHFEIPIDENMPISKDSNYLSANSNGNALQSSETTDAELDKELQDGIATAVMPTKPRLRVKPDIFFTQPTIGSQQTSTEATKSSANSSEHLNTEELMLPPPPPSLSFDANSTGILAEGIATPRISVLAVNRLGVKTEPSCQSNESEVNDGNPLQSSEIGNEETTDAELDKELEDGIATAVIPTTPRLRVKPELSFIQPPLGTQQTSTEAAESSANSSEHLNTEELMLPPPPPALSSNSNSDLLADGIATPRISLLAVNRLRVKTEFSPQSNESDSEENPAPDNYFDDLLQAKSPKEPGEVRDSNSDLDSEGIPRDYFDDLLQAVNVGEHEEKYSEKIKEKECLRNDSKTSKDKHKSHKKQKKTKRKTRKRSRSRSRSRSKSRSRSPKHYNGKRNREYRNISPDRSSLDNQRKRSSRRDASPASPDRDRKRSRQSPSRLELPTTSRNAYRNEDFQTNYSLRPQENSIRVKQEIEVTTQAQAPEENIEEIEKALTPTQKRERAIKRATALLNHLKNTSSGDNFINTTFQFASTVRKLPTSHSYVQQQIYENRSPLHTVNNVSYKFNSHNTRFNLEEWGLASLPPNATKVAKRVGCSAQFIYDKLKTITIPAKLKKIKNESHEHDNEEGEELIESNSSLFCNAMTQTDEDTEYQRLKTEECNDIAIQAVPSCESIACQTLENQSPTSNTHDDDEAPIMKIIRDLNENQLMAIHSFAELIKEPPIVGATTTAMEMYKIQTKIMDIYKISQIPSAVMPPQSQIVNNYTTAHRTVAAHRQESYTQPVIQSVQSANGTQFSIHDQRTRASAYNGRNISDAPPPAYNNNNGRYYGNSQPVPSSSAYRQSQPPGHSQASPPGTVKKYGRGALRRY